MKSYRALEDILQGIVLESFQTVDLLWSLMRKTTIIAYDPGMGKTVIAAAIMKALWNENNQRKILYFVENSQLAQTPDKIINWTGLRCSVMTAQDADVESVMVQRKFRHSSILLLTHDCLNSLKAMKHLFLNKEEFCCVIVDEVHQLSNFTEASSAFMLKALLRNFEYSYGMTATPMTTSVTQIAKLIHLFDWNSVPDVNDAVRAMNTGTTMESLSPGLVVNRTRKDLGISNNYRTHVKYVDPHEHQVGASGNTMFITTKGPKANNQISALLEIVGKNRGRKGIIYCHFHEVRKFVVEHLEGSGIYVDTIHGKMGAQTHSLRREIFRKFDNYELEVVVTSVATGQDLDCDYVVLYEFDVDLKQVIGRSERGLNPKTIDLYYIFTKGTGEIPYFLENIYARSLIVQQVVSKDYNEIVRVGRQLK